MYVERNLSTLVPDLPTWADRVEVREGVGLDSLEGVPKGARIVTCRDNNLLNLSGLHSNMPFLEGLDVSDNLIGPSLAGCPKPMRLFPFRHGNKKLVYLDVSNNIIDSLEGLQWGYTYIRCRKNSIKGEDPVTALTSAIYLDIGDNCLGSLKLIPPVMSSLLRLDVDSCCLVGRLDDCPVSSHGALLNVDWNHLTTLDGIPDTYHYISCRDNDIKTLEGCPRYLRYIDITGNSNLKSLEGLPDTIETIVGWEGSK